MKIGSQEYLDKVAKLTPEEQERLLSRMGGKLPHRLQKAKLSREEALAIQLEIEDEQLQEWREKMLSLNEKTKGGKKTKAESKPVAVLKVVAKPKAATKAKVIAKAKDAAKPKVSK